MRRRREEEEGRGKGGGRMATDYSCCAAHGLTVPVCTRCGPCTPLSLSILLTVVSMSATAGSGLTGTLGNSHCPASRPVHQERS